ncbi:MAG: B12-binding domain-containing radical SAM protein [Elusimicrobia bacterium]|nr:B12-binding domain-containing radical SAM protein [Elusimicrobiota bacterium]
MNILFQEPIVDKSVTYGKFSKGAGNNTFPYGIASIAGYIIDKGHDVKYLEPNIEGMDFEAYGQYLMKNDFQIIAMSSTTLQINQTIKTFEFIKKIKPETITVLGGVHATIMPSETLNASKAIDYLVIGEGEVPFLKLISCLDKNKAEEIACIGGVAFKKIGGEAIVNSPAPENILRSADLPTPPYHLFPMNKYIAQITYTKRFPSYSIVASRGCPFKCSFCNGSAVFGNTVRYKSPDRIINEILTLKNEYGAKGIIFLDSTFTINKQWLAEFCRKYIEKKAGLPWACNSRTDTVNESLLRLMRSAGCWEILYGVESGNQKSLDIINKGTTVRQNTNTLKLTMSLGFYTYASYILCLPNETESDALNTIKYAVNIGTSVAMFYLPVPYPGTELHKICREKGILREDAEWEDFNAWDFSNPVYINPLIGKERMQAILKRAYNRYYINPKVICANLKEILLFRQDIKKFIYALKGIAGLFK